MRANGVEASRLTGVTDLLLQWRNGDRAALDQLIPLVYAELRRIARRALRGEKNQETLQTTGLVNEVYLRLVNSSRVQWRDRVHFFAVTAQLMRRILVDEARRRNYQKRGGGMTRLSLEEGHLAAGQRDIDLLVLDRALEDLACVAPRKARVVEMRFFAGLTIEETAGALDVSIDVVKREWRTAKLWLMHALDEQRDGTGAVAAD
jgi:RNA polymerase sigma factor (TIGR02999 family)